MRPVAGPSTRAGGMNEDPRNAVSIHLRASLVPAAAVIPAQVAYFDVVAVKKLVVCWYPGLRWATERGGCPTNPRECGVSPLSTAPCASRWYPPLDFSLLASGETAGKGLLARCYSLRG